MNLIADINPCLKREYKIDKFIKNEDTKIIASEISMGGKAIETAKLHDILGAKYLYLTLLGGESGFLYENLLKEKVENIEIVKSKDEIRELIKINAEEDFLKLFTKKPRITMEEEQTFYAKYMECAKSANFTIIDADYSDDDYEILENLVGIASKNNFKIAVAPNEKNIAKVMELKPYLVILDKNLIGQFLNSELDFEWEINKAINAILERGISQIMMTDGKNSISLYTGSEILRGRFKRENEKDLDKIKAMTAYAIGLEKRYETKMCLELAISCAKLAKEDLKSKNDAAKIKELMKFVEIERYNVI